MPSNNNVTGRRNPEADIQVDEFEALLEEDNGPATEASGEKQDDFDSLLDSVSESSAPASADHMKCLMEMQAVLNTLMSSTSIPSSVKLQTAYDAIMALKEGLPEAEQAQAAKVGAVPASRARYVGSRMKPPASSRIRGAGSSQYTSRITSRFGSRANRAGMSRVQRP